MDEPNGMRDAGVVEETVRSYEERRKPYKRLERGLNGRGNVILHLDTSDQWRGLAHGKGGAIYEYVGERDAIAIVIDGEANVTDAEFMENIAAAVDPIVS